MQNCVPGKYTSFVQARVLELEQSRLQKVPLNSPTSSLPKMFNIILDQVTFGTTAS